jgi:hypothetical protein
MDKLPSYLQAQKMDMDFDEPSPQLQQKIMQQSKPSTTKKVIVLQWVKWAAAAFLIGFAGIGVYSLLSNKKLDTSTIATKTPIEKIQNNDTETAAIIPTETIAKNEDTDAVLPKTNATKQAVTSFTKSKKQSPLLAKTKLPKTTTLQQTPINKAIEAIDEQFLQVVNIQKDRIKNTPLFAENETYFKDFKEQMKLLDNDEQATRNTLKKDPLNADVLGGLITIYQQKLGLLKSLQTEINKLNNKYKQNKAPIDSARSYFLNI